MRYKKRSLKAIRNKILPIEFVRQPITSYSGLQLFKYYLELIGFYRQLQSAFKKHNFRGDYEIVDIIILVILMKIVGAERLSHIEFLKDDPLFVRLSGLSRIPHRTTIIGYLNQFTSDALKTLIEVNGELVMDHIEFLGLNKLTIDLDGTVISTKGRANFTAKGYNPIKKGARSYFPLTAHIAETGHFLSVMNRPGNIHDSNRALPMIKKLIQMTKDYTLRFRADSAFSSTEIVDFLLKRGIEFAIKAPFWKLKVLKNAIEERKRWFKINDQWSYFWIEDPLSKCEYRHRGLILRKKIKNPERNFQLDLFCPNNGVYEYSCIVTNLSNWDEGELFNFMSGRSAQENSIGELKSDFHFDHLVGKSYQANSANLQFSQMAYNLMVSMQIDSGLAKEKKQTEKKTRLYKPMKMKTFRFKVIYKAGKIVFNKGSKVLKLTFNQSTKNLYENIQTNLKKIA